MLFAFVLVLTQALAIQANAIVPDVRALCSDKQIELTTVAQLKELAAAVRTSKCPAYLKGAIIELSAIIEQDKEDLCSVDAADTLRAYYTQYLDKASIKEDNKSKLPKSLVKFVLAYGLQVSNLCKKQMVKVLSKGARDLLPAEDFEQVDRLTDEKSALADMLKVMGGPDEVILPGDLAPIFNKNGATAAPEKLFIQSATAPWIKQLQSVCQKRFKPIYEPLMIPLVRLSNMGFNYKDERLTCNLECSETAQHVGQWSRIVFLCESLSSVHMVDDPESKELTEGTKTSAVKIITKEEAEAIEGTSSADSDSASEMADFDYKPTEQVKLGDIVLDKNDKLFTKALDSMKVGQSEVELAKRTLVTKGIALLKSQQKKGGLGVVASATFRAMTSKDSKSAGSVIIKTLDEIVASSDNEEAVSGIGRGISNFFIILAVGIVVLAFLLGVVNIIGAFALG